MRATIAADSHNVQPESNAGIIAVTPDSTAPNMDARRKAQSIAAITIAIQVNSVLDQADASHPVPLIAVATIVKPVSAAESRIELV